MTKHTENDIDRVQIPGHDVEVLARAFLPAIREFYESEEGQREFGEWLKNVNQEQIKNN
jgi:hypothetical protein